MFRRAVPSLECQNCLAATPFTFLTRFLKETRFICKQVLKYFTKFYANSYNPLLAEFNLQNEQEIGGYPVLDFFINAQIQRTRLFIKAEHFNSSFSKPNYFTAPGYPYRDFIVRFGLVWNFFI